MATEWQYLGKPLTPGRRDRKKFLRSPNSMSSIITRVGCPSETTPNKRTTWLLENCLREKSTQIGHSSVKYRNVFRVNDSLHGYTKCCTWIRISMAWRRKVHFEDGSSNWVLFWYFWFRHRYWTELKAMLSWILNGGKEDWWLVTICIAISFPGTLFFPSPEEERHWKPEC